MSIKITLKKINELNQQKVDCCVYLLNSHKDSYLNTLPKKEAEILKTAQKNNLLNKKNKLLMIPSLSNPKINWIIIYNIETKKKFSYEDLRECIGTCVLKAKEKNNQTLMFLLDTSIIKTLDPSKSFQSLAEGCILANYEYNSYKTNKEKKALLQCTIGIKTPPTLQEKQGLETGIVTSQGVCFSRDLANCPANDCTPIDIVNIAKKAFNKTSVSVSIIDEKKAKALKMNAFLGVAQGSANKPYLLILEYKPISKQKPIALIGKGVTFDSGGISIKPSKSMSEMKADMGGAANVLGAMFAISKLNPKQNVIAAIPLAENMPSATAQRPGDIVTAMNNKTIEILNTDAEGRLILADAMCYISKFNPSVMIDMATLTGACLVALGQYAAGLFGNTENEIENFKNCAEFTGERVWNLPLYEEYLEDLKSETADIANCSEGRYGGASTAAKFLEQFVENIPWLHLDIAGVMRYNKTKSYQIKGMSGEGTRNLIEYICQKEKHA